MGRRALRKVDPELDLSGYRYDLEEVSRPWDPAEFFGRAAPLEVELGSGKGLFLQNATGAHPDRNFLGLEVAQKYAAYCAARLARRQLTNGKVICGDGLRFFREWMPPGCAAAVHVYFPDPWWKKRHRKRRVMTDAFLLDVQRVLEPGGELHFWTDVEEYFRETLAMVATHPGLLGPFEVTERPAEHDLDFRTHFERRCRLGALSVYRARFVRAADSAASP
ncbi:MAG: tRNA (guanosine(46)-N7)-methyltransferase TrmB [Pirellulaceae bacterium]